MIFVLFTGSLRASDYSGFLFTMVVILIGVPVVFLFSILTYLFYRMKLYQKVGWVIFQFIVGLPCFSVLIFICSVDLPKREGPEVNIVVGLMYLVLFIVDLGFPLIQLLRKPSSQKKTDI